MGFANDESEIEKKKVADPTDTRTSELYKMTGPQTRLVKYNTPLSQEQLNISNT